jgi:hypothetical protein
MYVHGCAREINSITSVVTSPFETGAGEDENMILKCVKIWTASVVSWSWVRFPALPDFLRSSGSGTGSTQPREDN